ncbi:COG3650 family protein [Pseudooceanicola sp. 200-1SW]|uniref:COG3650 family protein n=1 Tax=Pseudooceanicola sp. 200-1SW TaxID=3425949 RepID=UPI003D7FDFD7
MSRLLSLLCLCLIALALPGTARAQPQLPALYAVTGVAANDRLNIRAAPSARAEILGSFDPDAERVEVIRLDPATGWGQVNLEGRQGWVSMRYLRAMPQRSMFLSSDLACFGTEPFWLMARASDAHYVLETPDSGRWPVLTMLEDDAPGDRIYALSARSEELTVTGVMRRELCSDGMSDSLYGFSVGLVLNGRHEGEERYRLMTGCCTLTITDPND